MEEKLRLCIREWCMNATGLIYGDADDFARGKAEGLIEAAADAVRALNSDEQTE